MLDRYGTISIELEELGRLILYGDTNAKDNLRIVKSGNREGEKRRDFLRIPETELKRIDEALDIMQSIFMEAKYIERKGKRTQEKT